MLKVLVKEVGKEVQLKVIDGFEDMQKIVGGYVETLRLNEDTILIMNETGKLDKLEKNFLLFAKEGLTIHEIDDIMGNAIFVGFGEEDFISLTDSQIKGIKARFTERQLGFMV